MRRFSIWVLALALLVVGVLSTTAGAAALKDISTSWAKSDIESLVQDGVINGYPDNTFRPENPISRAEFAKVLANAFHFEPSGRGDFPDIRGHWAEKDINALIEKNIIQGYPDGTFKPNAQISRAEMVTMLIRAVRLDGDFGAHQFDWWPSFEDVPETHWAHDQVEIASRLGIVPSIFLTRFQPEKAANREETAAMIRTAKELITVQGTLENANNQNMLVVAPQIGQSLVLEVAPDANILRNNTKANSTDLLEGDQVYVVTGSYGSAQFVKASGIVTQADVMSKVLDLSKGFVTKEQLTAIMQGDWQSVQNEMKYSLYDQLLQNNIKPHEAEAIITQDWASLSGLGQERLAEALSEQWDIPMELIIALLQRDWKAAQTYGQVELTQRILGGLLTDSN
ncbi:MAG: S-layer homology domain-containing protein [Firmicutes bacterium]|mgnify:FL=1|nr:S-layer homology domain-containing protein [Bacillota bacterium]